MMLGESHRAQTGSLAMSHRGPELSLLSCVSSFSIPIDTFLGLDEPLRYLSVVAFREMFELEELLSLDMTFSD
jgi:hypothetical protein